MLRFPLIVLVVFIHNNFHEIRFAGAVEPVVTSEYIQIVRTLISDILARAAVPLLFLISGFLLYKKNPNSMANIKKKSKSILLPYLLWITVAILFFYLAQSLPFASQYFSSPHNLIRNFSFLDWVDAYFGKFTNRAPYPFLYPFWFLRDLFILNLCFPFIKAFLNKAPLTYLLTTLLLWMGDIHSCLFSAEALFFFSIGFQAAKCGITVKSVDSISFQDATIAYLFFITLELFIYKNVTIIHKANILLGSVVLLKTANYLANKEVIYTWSSKLEGYAFFLYASHEPLLTILKKISAKSLPQNGVYVLVQYFAVTAITVLISLFLGVILRSNWPAAYSILTGERKSTGVAVASNPV